MHPVVSLNMASPLILPLPNGVQYLAVFVYSSENFLSNFIKPAIFFILLHIHVSKASDLLCLR